MTFTSNSKPIAKVSILLAFVLCFIYWAYLVASCQTQIIFDAQSYERLGKIFFEQGWLEYFKTGPSREPFYPLIIAFAMKIAVYVKLPYIKVLCVIHFLFIFLTQILSLKILTKLNIRPAIKALVVIYLGISPGLVNSALSLFSEIITYPFILGIVLLGSIIWQKVKTFTFKNIFSYGFLLCLLFIGITFSKAIFSYISFLFMTPFILLGLYHLCKRDFRTALKLILLLTTIFVPLLISIKVFKQMNQRYNGHYAFSDRTWLLYGNTDRRTRDMPPRLIWAGLSFIPGENICDDHFTKEECFYWSIMEADTYAYYKTVALSRTKVPQDNWDKEYVSQSMELIKTYPLRYSFFFGVESLKMFFWESTQIGTVTYPPAMEKLYGFMPFKNGIRLLLSVLTFFGFIYLIVSLWRSKKTILSQPSEQTSVLVVMFMMIVSFIFFYSIVQIIPRYLFTIVPLYLISIGFWLDNILKRRS